MSRFTLAFHGEREAAFREQFLEKNLRFMRMSAIIATLLLSLFALTDLTWATGQTRVVALLMRYAWVLPLQILGIVATLKPRWHKAVPYLFILVLVSVALVGAVINGIFHHNQGIPVELGLLLVAITSYTFFRLRFVHANVIAAMVILISFAVYAAMGMEGGEIAYRSAFLIPMMALGGFTSYGMEYYARIDFLHREDYEREKRLEIEAENLRTAQELARTIAHEFNNPLQVLQATYDLEIRELAEALPHEKVRTLERIPAMVERMTTLVDRLLAITHVSQREYVEGIQMLDLHQFRTDDHAPGFVRDSERSIDRQTSVKEQETV